MSMSMPRNNRAAEEEILANLIPTGDRVIIRMHREDAVTAGGLIKPETSRKKLPEGTIVSVSPTTEKLSPTHIGWRVFFRMYAAVPISIGGNDNDYYVLDFADVDVMMPVRPIGEEDAYAVT